MSRDYYTIEELTIQLGKQRRAVEKQVSRGHIPGRRVSGEWRFNKTEITDWLEREMSELSEPELAVLERSHPSTEVCAKSPISSLLLPDLVEVPLDAGTKPSVLKNLVEVAGRTWQLFDSSAVLQAIRQREETMSTGFDGGVAIPHPSNRMPEALGIDDRLWENGIRNSLWWPSPTVDGSVFLVLTRDDNTHLKVLARLGRLLQLPDFLDDLRGAEDSMAAYDVIIEADTQLGE